MQTRRNFVPPRFEARWLESGELISSLPLYQHGCAEPNCRATYYIGAPYCERHRELRQGLRIGQSRHIKGCDGVFATRRFEVGTLVASYACERVCMEELEQRYGPQHAGSIHVYTLDDCRKDKKWADAALDRCIASMFNDAHGTGLQSNCEFVGEKGDKVINVVACMPIERGDEILVDYGKGYWKSFKRAEIGYSTVVV